MFLPHHLLPRRSALSLLFAVAVMSAPLARAAEGVDLVVQPGDSLDTLSRLLLRPRTGWQQLARLNRLDDPHRLMPGQVLRVPVRLLRQVPVTTVARTVTGDVTWQAPAARGGHSDGRNPLPVAAWSDAAPAQPLLPGQALPEGAVVKVGLRGSAVLQLPEGSQVRLLPDSVAALSTTRMAGSRAAAAASPVSAVSAASAGAADTVQDGWFVGTMRLLRGSLEVLAAKVIRAKPLEVQTPTTVLGVRGTHYRARLMAANDAVTPPVASREAAGAAGILTIAEVLEGHVATGPRIVLDAGQGARVAAGGAPQVRLLPPAPDLSSLPARFERPLVRWPAPTDSAVRVQVAADQAFERILQDVFVPAGGTVRLEDLPDGLWHVRMRRVDDQGVAGLDAVSRFELDARPEPPPLIAPRPQTKHPEGPVGFAWAGAPGMVGYALDIARDAGFTDRLTPQPMELAANEFTVQLAPGRYHWRVRSISAGEGSGPWGDAQTLEVRPDPLPPQKHVEPDGSLVLTWGALPGTADLQAVPAEAPAPVRYQAELAQDEGFTQPIARVDLDQPQWRLPPPRLGRASGLGVAVEGPAYFRYRTVEADGYVSRPSQPVHIDLPRDRIAPWLLLGPLLLGL